MYSLAPPVWVGRKQQQLLLLLPPPQQRLRQRGDELGSPQRKHPNEGRPDAGHDRSIQGSHERATTATAPTIAAGCGVVIEVPGSEPHVAADCVVVHNENAFALLMGDDDLLDSDMVGIVSGSDDDDDAADHEFDHLDAVEEEIDGADGEVVTGSVKVQNPELLKLMF